MAPVTLKARFDGEQIVLDEPLSIPRGARLLVTVIDSTSDEAEEAAVARLALARAYGPDEPEYSEADIIR